MHRIIHETTGDTLFEGYKDECDVVMKAFNNYNNCHRIVMKEVKVPEYLTEHTRNKVQEALVSILKDCSFGDGLEEEYVWEG